MVYIKRVALPIRKYQICIIAISYNYKEINVKKHNMTDVHDKRTRSYNMSQIKNRDTKPEILVRKFLFDHGFRYRLNYYQLPGKPDIVLSKYKTVIFINGCFWHGHDSCKYFVIPKTRTDWWLEKISETKKRDKVEIQKLKEMGWKVKVIWECELKADKKDKILKDLIVFLNKNQL